MKELEEKVVGAFRGMVDSGKLDALIASKVEATVGSVLEDILRPYSDFGRGLKEAMTAQLGVDFSNLGLDGYNAQAAEVIRHRVNSITDAKLRDGLEKMVESVMSDAPAEVRLSEIVESIMEDASYKAQSDGWEHPTIITDSKYSSTWVDLDPEPGKDKYRCKYRLLVDEDGSVSHVSVDGEKLREILAGKVYGLDRTFFHLTNCGTKLKLDLSDSHDVSYPHCACA